MEKIPVELIIQPHPDAPFWEVSFRAGVENGIIVDLQGIGGITQPEDSVGLLHRDERNFRCPSFLWSHYTSLRLCLDASDDTLLVLEGAGTTETVRVGDIARTPSAVSTGANGRLLIARYEPSVEGVFRVTPDTATVGSEQPFTIEFTVGDGGIKEGGGIRVQTPYSSWSFPELFDGAVSSESAGLVELETSLYPYFHPMAVFGYVYWIRVRNGRLSKGDVIRIAYSGTEAGITVQTYPKERAPFPAFIDSRGEGIYYPFPYADVAGVRVVAGAPSRLRLAVPMVVRAGEPFEARVIALDEHRNPVYDAYSGRVRLMADPGGCIADAEISPSERGAISFEDLRLPDSGMYVLTAEAEGPAPASLVVKCTDQASDLNLYWGSIHGHTGMSDGEGDTALYYPYGREVGLLDFCALADHEWEVVEHERCRKLGGFRYIQELAQRYNDPGRFVTLSGYEWMGHEGHANVYYNNDSLDNPIYLGNISIVERNEAYHFAELLDRYRGEDDVIVIPHTSHGFVMNAYDPELMPAVEVYSCWGCSEMRIYPGAEGANDALQRGYRLAFIGGADSHHSCPGHTGKPSKYHVLGWREGFAAVYAPELTRDAIFNGLRSKQCYATTAERIYLEFSVNGHSMGGSVTASEGSALRVEALVGGTAPIERMELVRGGEVVHSVEGSSLIESFGWDGVVSGGGYYYLRVTQSDGERAWSSPVWVEME